MNAPATLFDYAARYPNAPGYRNTDTSRAAAKAMEPRLSNLQAKVMAALREHGPLATFEIELRIGETYAATQPRTSELRAKGLIVDSGTRRTHPETGRSAIVWRLVNPHG